MNGTGVNESRQLLQEKARTIAEQIAGALF
jgi:hypothetical protein